MGCKGSKEGEQDKKIDSEFKHTGLPKFDEVFTKAHDILESCEKIREGLEDSKEEGARLSNTYKLQDPKFLDSLQILLWSLSVEGKGKIKDVGLTVGKEVPYLQLDSKKCQPENAALYDSFSTYVKTCTESPEELKSSVEKLNELAALIPEAITSAKSELEASSMNFKEKAEALMKINKNATKLPKELEKCKNLNKILQDAALDLKDITPKLPDMVGAADDIGAKLFADNVWTLADIFEREHKGARKPSSGTEKKDDKKKDDKKENKKDEKKEKSPEKKKEDKKEDKADDKKVKSPEKQENKADDEKAKSPEKKEDKVEEKKEEKAEDKKEDKVDEKKDDNTDEKKEVTN